MSLVDKIRASRAVDIIVNGTTFHCRRPTDEEFGGIKENTTAYEVCRQFVCGWSGVKESDLFEGGTQEDVAFNADLFSEYIADRADVAIEISRKLISEAVERINKKQKAIKNLGAGSKASK